MNFEATSNLQYPAVGDFVMIDDSIENAHAIIHHILPRKSLFTRKAVGVADQIQVVAANIDIVFICMSLNHNYNLNRLERYISITWDSDATPIIILTKSDLSENLPTIMAEVKNAAPFCEVIVTSMFDENTAKSIGKYLNEGITAAFVGSSGVGKSTLINLILGKNEILTRETYLTDKGKHTTSSREIYPTIYGGAVIDTPGMRELGIVSADLSNSFSEIEELAESCRYNDCTHTNEPGCAVTKALEDGKIDSRRLENYFKIKREDTYDGLNAKEIENKKNERMFKDIGGVKNVRKLVKDKRNR